MYKKSIFNVEVNTNGPNFFPWNSFINDVSGGTGFYIKVADKVTGHLNNYIITCAHVVENSHIINISRHDLLKKYKCSVHKISMKYDLALLKCHDKECFKNLVPLQFSKKIYVIIGEYCYRHTGTSIAWKLVVNGITKEVEPAPIINYLVTKLKAKKK